MVCDNAPERNEVYTTKFQIKLTFLIKDYTNNGHTYQSVFQMKYDEMCHVSQKSLLDFKNQF